MATVGSDLTLDNKAQRQPLKPTGSLISGATPVPQFALDAADAKIAALSSAVVGAADTIDQFLSSSSSSVPESAREFATSISQKLRSLGTNAGEQQAADLVQGLQKKAAAHPAAAMGVGALIGAALAGLLVHFGSSAVSANTPAKQR